MFVNEIMKARMLNVLDINDEPSQAFESGRGRAKHFSVDKIATWKEAQRVLAGQSKRAVPDLLLLDVSFNKDASVKGAILDSPSKHGNTIVPVGPFLALPFLSSNVVMGFAPYSAHLGDEYLTKYPPFLVAMGLIAAKMNGSVVGSKYLSHKEGDDKLDAFIENLKTKRAGDTNTALAIAIDLYRKNFLKAIENERLSLFNSDEVTHNLDDLRVKFETSSKKVAIPSDWGLEVVDSQGNQDCVSLLSLFADVLSWNKWADEEAVEKIYSEVKEAGEHETAFVKAIKAIEKQDKDENEEKGRERIDRVINQMYSRSSPDERREILRLCVLFANVHACSYFNGHSFKREDVYQRLGITTGQRTYTEWFGNRALAHSPSAKNVSELTVEPLPPLNNSPGLSKILDRYFFTNGTLITNDDDILISKYRGRYSDTNKAASDYLKPGWFRPYKVEE